MPTLSEDAKQLIKDAVDVESLLRALGFNISRATSSEVRAPCALHGGDNPTAFSIRLDTKKWRCFTHKCELDDFGRTDNDLISLVRKRTARSFMDAIRYLAEFAGLSMDLDTMFVEDTDDHRRRRDMRQYIRSISRVADRSQTAAELSEDLIATYCAGRDDYFVSQGFQPATLAEFEVGSLIDTEGVRRATVPIRDTSGVLVGLSARREDSDMEPRYLLEYKFQKGKILYNLHRALASGEETVILVEGFKALWAVYEAGLGNVVACMGANITEDQKLALCMSGFRNCLILFDGDKAGQSGAKAVAKKLRDAFNITLVSLEEGRSPDDYSRKDLRDLLDLYLSCF